MRGLAPLFERYKVDVVFAGHVHNYQRSLPLTFAPKQKGPDAKGYLPGDWTLDKEYDGVKKTHPKGIIYLVTGAGGANLYNLEQQDYPQTWQPFTTKLISKTHSFTLVDLTDKQMTVKQVSETGDEVDSFVITK